MAIKFLNKDKSMLTTLPKAQNVHGIEVKKVPIGQYLTAMRELEDLPLQIVGELFPGKTLTETIAEFVEFTDEKLAQIVVRLITVIPDKAIRAFSTIIGVDEDRIKNELTPKELYDVFKAYWDLNDMTDFFAAAAGLVKRLLPQTLINGFSAGSPSPPSLK